MLDLHLSAGSYGIQSAANPDATSSKRADPMGADAAIIGMVVRGTVAGDLLSSGCVCSPSGLTVCCHTGQTRRLTTYIDLPHYAVPLNVVKIAII
jgi:hypothetical protein